MAKLFTPLKYLRVHHAEKRRYDWWIPCFLTVVCCALFGQSGMLLTKDGLLGHVLDFFRLMTGFYVASLGVVASLINDAMDKPMENSPKLDGDGLTRRRFLCLLFGYLAFVSLLSYTVLSGIEISSQDLTLFVSGNVLLKLALGILISFPFFHVVCITGLGLHYLSERMFRAEIKPPTRVRIPDVNARRSRRRRAERHRSRADKSA